MSEPMPTISVVKWEPSTALYQHDWNPEEDMTLSADGALFIPTGRGRNYLLLMALQSITCMYTMVVNDR